MSAISTDISEAIESIRQDRAHGAGWLARQAVSVLIQSLQDCQAQTGEEFLSYLREVGRALAQAQPDMAAVRNAVGAVVLAAVRRATRESLSATQRAAVVRARRIVTSWDKAVGRIIGHAQRTVPAGAILTHSHSATALAVLEHLGRLGSRVIATESAPLNEGRTTARLLARQGVPVTVISDAQAGCFVGQATAVLVGADTVFANGAVINKVGTYALALLARRAHIPFFVATETLKIAAGRPTPNLIADRVEETLAGEEPGLTIPAVYFDLTPPRLVTAFLTDEGVFAPRDLRPFGRRARRYQRALSL